MKELIERIVKEAEGCEKCRDFEDLIKVDGKPYLEFNVYEEWVPEKLECLFIAESPPGDPERFFYNPESKSQLRESLFDLLDIEGRGREGLLEFKERGLLLVDALECRVEKRRSIPKAAIKNCSHILRLKLELARLSTVKLVVMGRVALEALRVLGFDKLEGRRVIENHGKVVASQGFEVLSCVLPFPWNLAKLARRRQKGMEELRDELRKELLKFCT
jgi:uracil-DNA glycosylase